MVHVRETRGSAMEVKFLVEAPLAARIRQWARIHLQPDPHGTGPFADEYETASLYFDTPDFDVFRRRGSFGRAKYRIRRYGHGDQVFLERKLRRPGILIKRRTMAPLAQLDRLSDLEAGKEWGGRWFQERLAVRKLQPVCQVSYHRMARTIALAEGLARLTLDSHLHAIAVDEPRFTPEPGVSFSDERMILELKYRVQLPAIFRRLVEEFALAPRTASKYRLAMIAIGAMPPAAVDVPSAGTTDASYA
jgi:hypothetical protein